MKIQNITSTDPSMKGLHALEAREGAHDTALVFQKTITGLAAEQYETHLKTLVEEIGKQGDLLVKRADIKEFEKYRSLIKGFMDEVVSNGYEFSKESAFHARGRHKLFATVKTVNQKLDELAKEVLEQQAGSLELLSRVDEIRGLILDMML